jgi:Ca-activated chloride channel family protein
MNPNVLRAVAIIFALVVVSGSLVARYWPDGGGRASSDQRAVAVDAPPADAIVVQVAYSPEKERLLTRAFKKFNAQGVEVDGKPVFVRGTKVSSGAALEQIKEGKLKPVIWTPSSSFWGGLLTESADVPWIPAKSDSLVRTPLVIAMWEQQAKVLGWPKKQLGWSDILREAKDPQGFARYGHPEWGQFRLGHTNPDFSTSGLSAVVAEYFSATGKTEGLTEADITDPKARAQVRDIQSAIVHYGDTTLFFAEQMAKRGPSYASAVAMEETTLVDFNQRLRKKGSQKLVGLYPKEGTFYSDNPLMILNAPWVSKAEKSAAAKVNEFLLSEEVQSDVGKDGFRPSDVKEKPAKRLNAKVGVDPEQPKVVLAVPSPKVLAKAKALWREDRKPADVVIVLDISGSMLDENRLASAQKGLAELLAAFGPRDRAALMVFSDKATKVTDLTEMTPAARKDLQERVNGLFAEGGTAFRNATSESVDLLASEGNAEHIRASVVLTDGQDNRSTISQEQLITELEGGAAGEAGSEQPVRVFTIAYSVDALVAESLAEISEASGGRTYSGDPKTIKEVYTSISSFF